MSARRPIPLLALVLAAGGAETMQPTPARAPTPETPGSHLIDRVIPAYGMTAVQNDGRSRAGDLFTRVHAFLGDVEAKVMSGDLHRGSTAPAAKDGKKRKKDEPAAPAQRTALPEEQQLQALYDELVAADAHLRPAGSTAEIPATEQWQIDGCYADLARAAELLRLGLGDAAWNDLDAQHGAWAARYHSGPGPAREAKLNELMKEKKLSRREAEEELVRMRWEAPYPDARTIELPTAPVAPTEVPAAAKPVVEAARAVATPVATPVVTPVVEPEPATPAVAETPAEEPAAVEEPVAETPAEEPAMETPVEPEPVAEPEPEPAVEKPAPPAAKPTPAPEPASDLPDL